MEHGGGPAPVAQAPPTPAAGAPEHSASASDVARADEQPAGAASAAADPAPRAVPDPPATRAEPPSGVRDLESVRSLWPAVVEMVTAENGLLGACIVEAQPVAIEDEELTLAFATTAQFKKKKAEDGANRIAVIEALRSITGQRWQLSYELREGLAGEDTVDAQDSEERWVARFIQEFDAQELTDEQAEPASPAGEAEDGSEAPALTSNEKGV